MRRRYGLIWTVAGVMAAAAAHAQTGAAPGAVAPAPANTAPAPVPGACAMPDLGTLPAAEREPRRQQYLLCLQEQARTSQSISESLGRSSGGSRGDPARPVERGYSGGGFGAPGSGGYTGGSSGGGNSGGYSTDTLRR